MISLLDLLILSYPVGNHKYILLSHHIPLVHMHRRCIVICMCLKDLREKKMETKHFPFFREIWRCLLVKGVYSWRRHNMVQIMNQSKESRIHPLSWWMSIKKVSIWFMTFHPLHFLLQLQHMRMIIGSMDSFFWCQIRIRRLPHSSMGIL